MKKEEWEPETAVKRIPSDLYMLFMDELLLHKPRESIVLHKGLEIRVYTKHSWQSVYYEVRTREIKSRTVRIMTALAMVVSQEGDFSPAHIDLGSNTTATTSKKKKKKKKKTACMYSGCTTLFQHQMGDLHHVIVRSKNSSRKCCAAGWMALGGTQSSRSHDSSLSVSFFVGAQERSVLPEWPKSSLFSMAIA